MIHVQKKLHRLVDRKMCYRQLAEVELVILNSSRKMFLNIIRVFNANRTNLNTQLGVVVDPLTGSFTNTRARL